MIFSSLSFLFLFLPIVFIIYLFIKPQYANLWLLIASIVFYYIGDKEHIWLLFGIIVIAYLSGLIISKCQIRLIKKMFMVSSAILMIGVMVYYKYWNFMITSINSFLKTDLELKSIIFPVGISFFIFQAVSYVVDIYRGESALKNPIDIALYISFFPQLIAGPIVRFHDVYKYMDKKYRVLKVENLETGIWRFCLGLSKKVILANNLGGIANIVFEVRDISRCSVLYTWLGAVAYTLQIYYDFSGYSDMAIGLGKIFGFEFQENFNHPYMAKSLKEFWRRWHISLSKFFRDYVYIPMGGNKCTKARWMLNMLCVWLLTGIWHGSSWNYILWGGVYGVFLIFERFYSEKVRQENIIMSFFKHVYTMIIVVVLWVIFRTETISQAINYLKNMFGVGAKTFIDRGFLFQAKNYGGILAISVILCIPISEILTKKIGNSKLLETIKVIGLICCTISAISFIYMGSYNPFLYFMF